MVFEGIRGNGFTGDIAIDDVSYSIGSCVIRPSTAVPRPPTTSRPATTRQPTPRPTGYNCDFQTGFCTWTNDASAPFNWTRHRGSTSSLDTGPASDHTLKNGRKFLAMPRTNTLNIFIRIILSGFPFGTSCFSRDPPLRFYEMIEH